MDNYSTQLELECNDYACDFIVGFDDALTTLRIIKGEWGNWLLNPDDTFSGDLCSRLKGGNNE